MIQPHCPTDSHGVLADTFRGRRALITGGLGFIGSNLAIRLAEYGARVTIIDSLIAQCGGSLRNIESIGRDVSLHLTDLRDTPAIVPLLADVDFIFNLAGQTSHSGSMEDPSLDLDINCAATLSLLEACRRHNPAARMLYTSTRQVYGRPVRLPVDESHPAEPIDVNGIHKLSAERYHLLYHSVYGIRSTILRLTNIYGPRQNITGQQQGVVATLLNRAMRGLPLQLYGDGSQRRDFCYVSDVVDAALLAISTTRCMGKIFNIGDNESYSLRELAEFLQELCDCAIEYVQFPNDRKSIDIGDYWSDISQFRSATGWSPSVALREGIVRTLAFFRRQAGAPPYNKSFAL